MVDCATDSRKQRWCVERLAKESTRTARLRHFGELVTAGDQEYRKIRPSLVGRVAKVEPVHSGHPDIGYQQIETGQPTT